MERALKSQPAVPTLVPRPQPIWGIVDQGCSAASNFLLSVVVARFVPAREFGAFAVALVVPTVGILLSRSVATEPLFVRFAGVAGAPLRRGAEQALRASVGVGLALGVLAVVAGLAWGGTLGALLVVAGVIAPLVSAQDAGRAVCFTAGRPIAAAFLDGSWLVIQLVAFVALVVLVDNPAAWQFLLLWGLAGGLSGLALAIWAPLWPGSVRSKRWLVEHKATIRPTLAANTLTAAPAQLVWLLMPLVAGLTELGRLRGAYVIFGPLGVLHEGVAMALLPSLTARARLHRIVGSCIRVSLVLALAALCWGLSVAFMPRSLGEWLFGQSWQGAAKVRLVLSLSLLAEAVLVGAALVLRANGRQAELAAVRLRSAPITLAGVLLGAWMGGATCAAVGFVAGYGLAAVLGWRSALRGSHGSVIPLRRPRSAADG